MDEREELRRRILEKLVQRFRESNKIMEQTANKVKKLKMRHATIRLAPPQIFTFLEYLEFSSAEEFKKFKEENEITDEDIENCDIDELCAKLLEG